jgi:hypothetical protein
MKKLSKQQIVILAVMALVVLYGAYDILSPKAPKTDAVSPAARSAERAEFISEFTANTARNLPSKFDAYSVVRAEAKWVGNPFDDRKLYAAWKSARTPTGPAADLPKHVFTYTGYIQGGTKRIAIVNNVEYGVGDALDIQGYSVKEISPTKVVIVNKMEKKVIDVPLQE